MEIILFLGFIFILLLSSTIVNFHHTKGYYTKKLNRLLLAVYLSSHLWHHVTSHDVTDTLLDFFLRVTYLLTDRQPDTSSPICFVATLKHKKVRAGKRSTHRTFFPLNFFPLIILIEAVVLQKWQTTHFKACSKWLRMKWHNIMIHLKLTKKIYLKV